MQFVLTCLNLTATISVHCKRVKAQMLHLKRPKANTIWQEIGAHDYSAYPKFSTLSAFFVQAISVQAATTFVKWPFRSARTTVCRVLCSIHTSDEHTSRPCLPYVGPPPPVTEQNEDAYQNDDPNCCSSCKPCRCNMVLHQTANGITIQDNDPNNYCKCRPSRCDVDLSLYQVLA